MGQVFWKIVETLLMIDTTAGMDGNTAIRRWRGLVALFVLLFGVHIVWACGLLSTLGLEGFVQSKDVRELSTKVDNTRTQVALVQGQILDKAIMDMRIQQCLSTSKRYYTDRLRELTDQYYELNHRVFTPPPCEELN